MLSALTSEPPPRLSDNTPFLADLKPSGKYVMEDLQKYGGTPAVMKFMLENGMIHGDCMTVTGKTVAENLASTKSIAPDNPIVRPLSDPIKATGHLQILYGNLAPEGSVAKITGKEGLVFEGVAKVYDSEELMMEGLAKKEITKGVCLRMCMSVCGMCESKNACARARERVM